MMIFEDSYHGITFSYKEYEKMHSPLAGTSAERILQQRSKLSAV